MSQLKQMEPIPGPILFRFVLMTQIILGKVHSYITSAKGLGGWVYKIASFAKVQYCVYADIVGGSEKVPNYSDVIYA